MLCDICQKIFYGYQILEEITSLEFTLHHSSLHSLTDASESGCWICHKLLAAIKEKPRFKNALMKDSPLALLFTYRLGRADGPKRSYQLDFKAGDEDEYIYSLAVVSHKDFDGPTTNYATIAGMSTISDAAMTQATEWYHECLSQHTSCNIALGSRCYTPTRLLRIDEDQRYARLFETTEEVTHDLHYATLSHCWGDSNILKLTSLNRDKLKASIPLELLPKTFIEAIFVARKMSIPYIWIDSLCIVQDSITDWQAESALMEDVYSNGKLNFMATASKNSHEGLSRSRDPRTLELCPVVETKWKNAENHLFNLVNTGTWSGKMNAAPLIERGWVLQERILSPRSLHFCENELLWECRELAASETYPIGLPEICRSNQSDVKVKELSGSESFGTTPKYLAGGSDKTKKGVAYDRWDQWISLYSQTFLTNDSDKLVAVSALAKRTRAALNDVYVAGLWRSKFVDQLVWFALRCSPAREYRAPSWSWASINGIINLASIRPETECHIKIDEVQVTPVSSVDDTGSVSDGFFRARGLLLRDNLVKSSKFGMFHLTGKPRRMFLSVHLDKAVNRDETFEAPVVTLPILTYSTRKKNNPYAESFRRFQALLLQKKVGSPNGFYTRIGHMESDMSFMKNSKRSGPRKDLRWLFRKEVGSNYVPHDSPIVETGANRETDANGESRETDDSLYLADSPGSFIVY